MGDVIQFPKSRKMVPGWDLSWIVVRDSNEDTLKKLQDALDQGFEPFSVTSYQEVTLDLLSKQPKASTVEKLWLKRPVAPVPQDLEEPPEGPSVA